MSPFIELDRWTGRRDATFLKGKEKDTDGVLTEIAKDFANVEGEEEEAME